MTRKKGCRKEVRRAGLVGEGSAAEAEKGGSRQSQSSERRQVGGGELHLDEPGAHEVIEFVAFPDASIRLA